MYFGETICSALCDRAGLVESSLEWHCYSPLPVFVAPLRLESTVTPRCTWLALTFSLERNTRKFAPPPTIWRSVGGLIAYGSGVQLMSVL